MMVKKSLLFSNNTMITLSSFFNKSYVLVHLFLGWESDTIDSLETVIGSFSEPISRRILHNLESLDSASNRDMRASAKIYQIAIFTSSDFASIRNLSLDKLNFERVVCEKAKCFLLA